MNTAFHKLCFVRIQLIQEFLAECGAFFRGSLALFDYEAIFYGQGLAGGDLRLEVGTEASIVALAVKGWFRVGWMIKIKSEVAVSPNDDALPLPGNILHVLVGGPVFRFAFCILPAERAYVVGLSCGFRGHFIGSAKLESGVLRVAVQTDFLLSRTELGFEVDLQGAVVAMREGKLAMLGGENSSIVDPPCDLYFLYGFVSTFLGDGLFVSLVASLAMPRVYADFLAVLVLRSALGEPEIYATVVRVTSPGTLGEELFAIGLVDVMEWLVGKFAVFWVHALIDVAGDVLSVFLQVDVFAGFVLPGETLFCKCRGHGVDT